jgi:hypothetical protein
MLLVGKLDLIKIHREKIERNSNNSQLEYSHAIAKNVRGKIIRQVWFNR